MASFPSLPVELIELIFTYVDNPALLMPISCLNKEWHARATSLLLARQNQAIKALGLESQTQADCTACLQLDIREENEDEDEDSEESETRGVKLEISVVGLVPIKSQKQEKKPKGSDYDYYSNVDSLSARRFVKRTINFKYHHVSNYFGSIMRINTWSRISSMPKLYLNLFNS